MKKVLKFLDFAFLRLIPTLYLALLFSTVLLYNLPTFFEMRYLVSAHKLYNVSISLSFVLLGIASILKIFEKTIKFSKYAQYSAAFFAAIQIIIYIVKDSIHPYELEVIAVLLLIVCCLLKDKFFKTKWILVILSVLIYVLYHGLPIYNSIISTHDFFYLRNYIVYCSVYIVIILGLQPVKKDIGKNREIQRTDHRAE